MFLRRNVGGFIHKLLFQVFWYTELFLIAVHVLSHFVTYLVECPLLLRFRLFNAVLCDSIEAIQEIRRRMVIATTYRFHSIKYNFNYRTETICVYD